MPFSKSLKQFLLGRGTAIALLGDMQTKIAEILKAATARRDTYLSFLPGKQWIKQCALYCGRQFMSDSAECSELTIPYNAPVTPGQSYTIVVCRCCASKSAAPAA